jgi:Metallo-beta-lactamase superfamily
MADAAPIAPDSASSVKMHLYCHGLGDCMLLELARPGGEPYRILIDCGIHTSANGGTEKIRGVVEDLAKVTGSRLDAIVGTHEHWDHISGFHQAEDLFRQFKVGEVWFAWTENPIDPQGRRLDKYKEEAAEALNAAAFQLGAAGEGKAGKDLDALLGFVFGVKGERSRDAREKLRSLAPGKVRHFEPGERVTLPDDLAETYRIYVMAPPRDDKLLGLTDSLGDTYRFGASGSSLATSLRNGLALNESRLTVHSDPLAPFDGSAGASLSNILAGEEPRGPGERISEEDVAFLSSHYAGLAPPIEDPGDDAPTRNQEWRRIDNEWLGMASELALQLDSRTNNTSLVLAVEIVASGKVLLFAADAQVGNWKSWKDVQFPKDGASPAVTGAELMKRTVFYKVGHHGSRNATLAEGGLELMSDPDLIAFIPTDEAMAKKVRWSDIPATGLLTRLEAKTHGRIIQSDRDWLQKEGVEPLLAKGGSLRSLEVEPGLRVTVEIG